MGVWGMALGSIGPLARYARAPKWLENWLDGPNRRPPQFGTPGGGSARMAAGGVHVVAPRRVEASESNSGYTWGRGQRLGSS